MTLSPVRDEMGTVTHFVGFQSDVTPSEEAVAGKARAQRTPTSTLDHMADGFASFDPDWNFTSVNDAVATLSGHDRHELIGRSLFQVFPEALHRPIGRALQRARASGLPQRELTFLPEVGRWLDAVAYPTGNGVSLFTRDVSESHDVQEKLRLSEERFSKVFQASPVAIAISRLRDNRFLDANPEFLAQSGYALEEVIGRTWEELGLSMRPEDLRKIEEGLTQRGEVRNLELRIRLRFGEERDNLLSVVPVEIAGEACTVNLIHNVTEQKRAQQALLESEQRYRRTVAELQRTLDISLDMITTIDAEGRFMTVSAACEQMLGYLPEELIGRRSLEFVHPEDRAATVSEERSVVQGRTTTAFQNRYLHKDGRVVWLEWAAVALPGDPLLYCAARDITQRRAAEEDRAYLAAIVEASQDAIIGISLEGQIRSWNTGAERKYGYPAAEAIGQPLTLISPPEYQDEQLQMFRQVKAGQPVEPFESVRVTRDGRRIYVLATLSPIVDASGQVVGVSKVLQDITARKATEDQIRNLNEGLQQQLRHLTGLREVDRAIASSVDLPITLGMVLENVRRQLNADTVTMLLLNPHTLTLECVDLHGRSSAALQGSSVKMGQPLAGQVALSRQPMRMPDLREVGTASGWLETLVQEGFRAYFAVPVIAKGKVLGVIEVFHQDPVTLTSAHWEMLEMLAGQAAIAVDNARLFEELERRNLELRLAYDETIEGWARALDLRDKETEGHSRRVTEMTVDLCRRLDVSAEQLVDIRRGALLHDIGKMGIPDAILLKPGKLTDGEWVEMKSTRATR